jgi:hypothetical protein
MKTRIRGLVALYFDPQFGDRVGAILTVVVGQILEEYSPIEVSGDDALLLVNGNYYVGVY